MLRVAEAVAVEKSIPKEAVIDAIEQAVKVAARRKYGNDYDVEATIDRINGSIKIYRRLTVAEEIEDEFTEILLKEAQKISKEAKVGDVLTQDLPPIDFGRVVAQVAKQVIVQKVRSAEREKQFEEFKDRVGEIINGVVKKVGYRSVLLEVGGAEAVLEKNDIIPNENLKQNDRVRAVIKEIVRRDSGPQIYLSRTSNDFIEKLFMQEVPEIYDGIIQMKAVSREPGSRAKVAVYAAESGLDPVGACVGVRGSRVQVVINELKGEKIDIIEWSSDPATFAVNALVPADIAKIVIDEERARIEAVVDDSQFSIAIGRRGQNVRLASKLIGWDIDILTEDEESKLRKGEFDKMTDLFINRLGLDDMVARLLISEGFVDIEEIVEAGAEELVEIEGFDDAKAQGLLNKVSKYISSPEYDKYKWEDLGYDVQAESLPHMSRVIMAQLVKNKVKTLSDLADLARDEFKEIIEESGLSDDQIDEMIMAARDIMFAPSEEPVENDTVSETPA